MLGKVLWRGGGRCTEMGAHSVTQSLLGTSGNRKSSGRKQVCPITLKTLPVAYVPAKSFIPKVSQLKAVPPAGAQEFRDCGGHFRLENEKELCQQKSGS